MIIEGRAKLATDAEKQQFREKQAEDKIAAEKIDMARRLQVAIVSDSETRTQLASRKNNGPSAGGK